LSAGNITHTPAYGNLIALGALTALQAHQAPVVVGCEQVRLVPGGGKQVEQHDANTERLISRDPRPELLEASEQETSVAGLVKIGFVPPAAEIADP
jgi:hypothetical protein